MSRKVVALIVAQLSIAGAAVVLTVMIADVAIELAPVRFVAFTIALVALLRLTPVYVELRRHSSWVTITDGAYGLGLVLLGPLGFLLSVVLAEIINWLWTPQIPIKRAFNLAMVAGGSAIGGLVFTVVGGTDPLDLRTWLGVTLALVAIALWDTVMNALVLTISEQAPLATTFPEIARPQSLTLVVSVPSGLIALILLGWAWPTLLLLVPLLGLLHVNAHAAMRQRADRQRVQRLADAASQVVELVGAEDLLVRIATQARELVTAASAVAVAVDDVGTITARDVGDDGAREVGPAELAAVFELIGDHRSSRRGELSPSELDPSLRAQLPSCGMITWVVHRASPTDGLIVAAFRETFRDDDDGHRADVLATFVAHAATALANVQLHARVQESLEHEQALNQRKDEFVATVSHELRTPLTSIGGAIETLRHRGDRIASADRDKLLDLALDHSGRLRGLIDDLLLVAEGQVHRVDGRNEPIDLVALLDGLVDEFQPWMHGQLSLRSDLADRWVAIDGDRVRRILAHLLDNARKYAAGSAVEILVTQRAPDLEFVVRDGGPGIAPGERDEVFERFVQLDSSLTRERGGLGLGLHLCRQLATALGGEIRVDDDPSGGARFTLRVPVAAARSTQREEPVAAASTSHRDEPVGPQPGDPSAPGSHDQSTIDRPTMGLSEPPRR